VCDPDGVFTTLRVFYVVVSVFFPLSNIVFSFGVKVIILIAVTVELAVVVVVFAVAAHMVACHPVELVEYLRRSPSKWFSDLVLKWRIPPARWVLFRSITG